MIATSKHDYRISTVVPLDGKYRDVDLYPGRKLTVRSLEWYNKNRNDNGEVVGRSDGVYFCSDRIRFCGKEVRVVLLDKPPTEYPEEVIIRIKEDFCCHVWYRWMFEEFILGMQ